MNKNEFSVRFIDMILLKEDRETLKDVNLNRLAKKVQIHPATFHQWLTGAFPKRIEHWKKIQRYFHCDLNYLIAGLTSEKKTIPNEGKIIISDNKKKLLELNYKTAEKSEIKLLTI